MERVEFTMKRGGRKGMVPLTQARAMQRAGLGTYQTRDMAFQPTVTKPMQAAPAPVEEPERAAEVAEATEADAISDDGLDALDKDQLHALAKDRGVKVHHMAGADKVRTALREVA